MQLKKFVLSDIKSEPNDWFRVCLLDVCKTFLLKIFLDLLPISCADLLGVYSSLSFCAKFL